MAVVAPLRPARAREDDSHEPVNVVRLVQFLGGPVSPELVLVDPELGDRARALLPDVPGVRVARRRENTEPLLLPLAPPPVAKASRWRLVVVSALAGAVTSAVGAVGIALWMSPGLDDEPAVRVSPSVTAPTSPSMPTSPTSETPPEPAGKRTPFVLAPRFVWPAEAGAAGYRFVLYRDGRPIFEREVKANALELPRGWTYEGRSHALAKGTYRWVVWPLVGKARDLRPGPAIVSAFYVV